METTATGTLPEEHWDGLHLSRNDSLATNIHNGSEQKFVSKAEWQPESGKAESPVVRLLPTSTGLLQSNWQLYGID